MGCGPSVISQLVPLIGTRRRNTPPHWTPFENIMLVAVMRGPSFGG